MDIIDGSMKDAVHLKDTIALFFAQHLVKVDIDKVVAVTQTVIRGLSAGKYIDAICKDW